MSPTPLRTSPSPVEITAIECLTGGETKTGHGLVKARNAVENAHGFHGLDPAALRREVGADVASLIVYGVAHAHPDARALAATLALSPTVLAACPEALPALLDEQQAPPAVRAGLVPLLAEPNAETPIPDGIRSAALTALGDDSDPTVRAAFLPFLALDTEAQMAGALARVLDPRLTDTERARAVNQWLMHPAGGDTSDGVALPLIAAIAPLADGSVRDVIARELFAARGDGVISWVSTDTLLATVPGARALLLTSPKLGAEGLKIPLDDVFRLLSTDDAIAVATNAAFCDDLFSASFDPALRRRITDGLIDALTPVVKATACDVNIPFAAVDQHPAAQALHTLARQVGTRGYTDAYPALAACHYANVDDTLARHAQWPRSGPGADVALHTLARYCESESELTREAVLANPHTRLVPEALAFLAHHGDPVAARRLITALLDSKAKDLTPLPDVDGVPFPSLDAVRDGSAVAGATVALRPPRTTTSPVLPTAAFFGQAPGLR